MQRLPMAKDEKVLNWTTLLEAAKTSASMV